MYMNQRERGRPQLKNISLILGFSFLLFLTGCPGTVNPGDSNQANYGSTSRVWGVPFNRVTTAGFNGYPSEPNGAPVVKK